MKDPLIEQEYAMLSPFLDERTKRVYAASKSKAIGRGGKALVSASTGISYRSIVRGCKELEGSDKVELTRLRQAGGGRKLATEKDDTLKKDLETLLEPYTRGEPESPLQWTCKSTRKLAEELQNMGHIVSHTLVSRLLSEMDYSLQANQKTLEGASHEDRNEQFEYIHDKVKLFQMMGEPVISVDTKKKELIGQYKNAGKEYQPTGQPEKVNTHDFPNKELGKVSPYGIYDLTENLGWVNVGTDHDTAAFAVHSIRQWWYAMGKDLYSEAKQLLITADSGGSNGYRVRLWKIELEKLAQETGLNITVAHFPSGTSKWNKIEHRLFCHITQNWRGRPLTSHEVVVNLIASTTTRKGLKVSCQLDRNTYKKGIKVSDEDFEAIQIRKDGFHPEWNYTILAS